MECARGGVGGIAHVLFERGGEINFFGRESHLSHVVWSNVLGIEDTRSYHKSTSSSQSKPVGAHLFYRGFKNLHLRPHT